MANIPEGACLRYPEGLGMHATITHEQAVGMLLRAIPLSQQTPYTWGYIDRPAEGQTFLIYILPHMSFPNDGIRYQDQEQKYILPINQGRELEFSEIKFGFIPGQDSVAFRVRRRFRLSKGGHPQLILTHYSRGQPMAIVPAQNQPVRVYPLRTLNEPAFYVMGEKMGQRVMPGSVPPGTGSVHSPMGFAGAAGVTMGADPRAMLAMQNNNMEALERRSQHDRAGSMGGRQQLPPRVDDEDSGDESDMISSRALALTRYARNHELMNEVFMHAAFGKRITLAPPSTPYSVFNITELDEKMVKLTSEVEALKANAAEREASRKAAEELVDVSMEIEP